MPLPLWPYKLLPFGRRSEINGAEYLRSLGFKVVASGYRTKHGEVDLIAWHGDILVFVEVKARSFDSNPEEAVNFRKRQRVIKAAHAYLAQYKLQAAPYRFDILAIISKPGDKPEYRLLHDAFRDNPGF
jgi:putative endonuclease